MSHRDASENERRPTDERPADGAVRDLYERLHDLAQQWFMRQPSDHTLQPTALVHEVYLKLADQSRSNWASRTHFYAIAATAMRQVLIDHARRRSASKRGGTWNRVTLSEAAEEVSSPDVDVESLSDALERLDALNSRQCRIVEMRYLAGMTVNETAAALGVSPRTVKLDWRMARAWLNRELSLDTT